MNIMKVALPLLALFSTFGSSEATDIEAEVHSCVQTETEPPVFAGTYVVEEFEDDGKWGDDHTLEFSCDRVLYDGESVASAQYQDNSLQLILASGHGVSLRFFESIDDEPFPSNCTGGCAVGVYTIHPGLNGTELRASALTRTPCLEVAARNIPAGPGSVVYQGDVVCISVCPPADQATLWYTDSIDSLAAMLVDGEEPVTDVSQVALFDDEPANNPVLRSDADNGCKQVEWIFDEAFFPDDDSEFTAVVFGTATLIPKDRRLVDISIIDVLETTEVTFKTEMTVQKEPSANSDSTNNHDDNNSDADNSDSTNTDSTNTDSTKSASALLCVTFAIVVGVVMSAVMI